MSPVPTNFTELQQRLLALEPQHATLILPGNPPPVVFNSAVWSTLGGTAWLGGFLYNSSGAINDGGAWDVVLGQGTWQLGVLVTKASSAGQLTFDISFDGGTTWTTVLSATELYNASSVNAVVTATGIKVPLTCKTRLRVRALGKNASSSGYGLFLSGILMQRTGS